MFVWSIRVCRLRATALRHPDSFVWSELGNKRPRLDRIRARCGPDTLAIQRPIHRMIQRFVLVRAVKTRWWFGHETASFHVSVLCLLIEFFGIISRECLLLLSSLINSVLYLNYCSWWFTPVNCCSSSHIIYTKYIALWMFLYLFNKFCILFLILDIMIPLEYLTDYTWHLPDNYIVHVTIVAEKILLHGNTLLLYLLHVMLYWYPI